MNITSIIPTLQVHNLNNSTTFFEKLGFNLDWKWPESAPSHASVSSSGHSIMLEKIESSIQPQVADLYFRVEDVKELHATFSKKGFEVSALEKMDYGMLDFSIKSPSGHHLVFGAPSGEFEG